MILPHVFALAQVYPTVAADSCLAKLQLMQKNLNHALAAGSGSQDAKTWPGPSEIALLRLIGIIWSTSDKNHSVVGPARLLMGSYLGLSRIRSLSDIGSGLFLCTVFFQVWFFVAHLPMPLNLSSSTKNARGG
jgi:nucleolar protein 14